MNNIASLKIKINRLQSQRAALITKIKTNNKSERKARTRTLIQIGGLVKLTGLLEYCDIKEGDNLQQNLDNHDKAAILSGILHHAYTALSEELSVQEIEKFKQTGIQLLKNHTAIKAYNYE